MLEGETGKEEAGVEAEGERGEGVGEGEGGVGVGEGVGKVPPPPSSMWMNWFVFNISFSLLTKYNLNEAKGEEREKGRELIKKCFMFTATI